VGYRIWWDIDIVQTLLGNWVSLLVPNCNQRVSYLRTVHYMTAIVTHDVNVSLLSSAIMMNLATGVA
jgi:hypothetical protein